MITGVSRKAIAYIPEAERELPDEDQTIFWIRPKRGKEANESMSRYAKTSTEGKKGVRLLNVNKLNSADIDEFISTIEKVEHYRFSPDNDRHEEGPVAELTSDMDLKAVCMELPSDILVEIFDASASMSTLLAGEKKSSSSAPSSTSGDQ